MKIESKKIAVIGDSHTRSFAFSNLFIPFCIGAGKKYCFIDSSKALNVLNKSTELIQKIELEIEPEYYMFVFGEPDTRWLLGKGWYPWNRKLRNPFIYYRRWELLECNLKRYVSVIRKILTTEKKIIIYGNTSIYYEQIDLAKRWNDQLGYCCQELGVIFVNILDDILMQDKVMDEYVNDISHANQKIMPLVAKKLSQEIDWMENFRLESSILKHSQLCKSFEYNQRFGSFVSKP